MFFYESTRNSKVKVTSKEAIINGLSQEGGLYVYPDLDTICVNLEKICQQSYIENAIDLLQLVLPDFSKEEISYCVHAAYDDHFDTPEITPLRKVGDVYVLELFHGPTSAFKDMALTLLPHLMQVALRQQHKKALILTATSGDTGKAALSGFQDVEDIGIMVFYPHQKVSDIQYRQMATQEGKNTFVYAIEGNFDDAQSQVKQLFLNEELQAFAKEHHIILTSANSINIGRLVPQILYYFESYKQLVQTNKIQLGDKIAFSVPTGNFGDVLAGYYAYLMGLPVSKFIVASNANHVLTDFLTTGVYDRNRDFIKTISPSMDILVSSNLERLLYYMSDHDTAFVSQCMSDTGVYDRNRDFIKTISPSMDILVSSNLERLLYYMSDHDTAFVSQCMSDLKVKGRYEIGEALLKKIQSLFVCGYLDDVKTKEVIANVYQNDHELVDPHTAIGIGVAQTMNLKPVVCLSTASIYKFAGDVCQSIGVDSQDGWQAMRYLESISNQKIPTNLANLQNKPILHTEIISKEEMKSKVQQVMEEMNDD